MDRVHLGFVVPWQHFHKHSPTAENLIMAVRMRRYSKPMHRSAAMMRTQMKVHSKSGSAE
jgi:hypothetical protein